MYRGLEIKSYAAIKHLDIVMADRSASGFDKIIGRNIRIQRIAKGITQTDLGDAIGITFQQVQKYEKGANRIGGGRLCEIASFLDVPIGNFFADVQSRPAAKSPNVLDLLTDPQSIRIVRAFAKISQPGIRLALVNLIEDIVTKMRAQLPR